MLTTIILASLFFGLLVLQFILWAFFLRIGLRWARVDGVTTRLVVGATVTTLGLQFLLNIVFLTLEPTSNTLAIIVAVAEIVAAIGLPTFVIMRFFKTNLSLSIRVWLPTLLPSLGVGFIAFFAVRLFVFEAFTLPTNSMAPTLLGPHKQGTCPECGRRSFGAIEDFRLDKRNPPLMICEQFHVHPNSEIPSKVFPTDRFLVAKFLAPKRWDIAVFQYPGEPSQLYAKRLVGLPGETVHIEEGAVWINGSKVVVPESLSGISYLDELPDTYSELWGTKKRPATLAGDEYFVLGDFSARSSDSRSWAHGASGHNSFAVPKSHLRGIVTHVFWPTERWRILR